MSLLDATTRAAGSPAARALPGANGNGRYEWAQAAVPAALAGTVLAGYVGNKLATRTAIRRGHELNERLREHEFEVRTQPLPRTTTELTPEELRWLRLPLELALQPLDSFDGFTVIDQFREAAIRYQLNYIGYTLAMSQFTRTPAFTGYVAEAQRNAIEKMLDKRTWRYWALENLWGNLRWNPDPIVRDNVMLSGYYALQIGLYERATGDLRYSRPGALTFRWSDRTAYEWDFGSIAAAEHRKMTDSPFCMYPCEPNWAFPFCNAMSLNGQLLHDRLHGTRYTDDTIPHYRENFDNEFVRPDGRANVIRSRRIGVALPFSVVTVSDAVVAYWMNPGLPELAQRTWWYIRDQLLDMSAPEADVVMRGWDTLDPGNYKMGNPGYTFAKLTCAAREMGDTDAAGAIQRRLDATMETIERGGVPRYKKMSTYANVASVLARITPRRDAMRDLIQHGFPEAWKTGPVLAEAAYPDVLVARAETDGDALFLVLRPGDGARRVTLGVERLVPGRGYAVEGGAGSDRVMAGTDGRALIDVDLGDRVEVRLWPEA